jgi:hypothetical protein
VFQIRRRQIFQIKTGEPFEVLRSLERNGFVAHGRIQYSSLTFEGPTIKTTPEDMSHFGSNFPIHMEGERSIEDVFPCDFWRPWD